MHSPTNTIEVLDPAGQVVLSTSGTKLEVAQAIFGIIADQLIED